LRSAAGRPLGGCSAATSWQRRRQAGQRPVPALDTEHRKVAADIGYPHRAGSAGVVARLVQAGRLDLPRREVHPRLQADRWAEAHRERTRIELAPVAPGADRVAADRQPIADRADAAAAVPAVATDAPWFGVSPTPDIACRAAGTQTSIISERRICSKVAHLDGLEAPDGCSGADLGSCAGACSRPDQPQAASWQR
jgi:hypothetical protein